jgi:hypothetical protein
MSNNILKRKFSEIDDSDNEDETCESNNEDESFDMSNLSNKNESEIDEQYIKIEEENTDIESLDFNNDNVDLEVQVEYYKSQIEKDDYLKTYKEDENGDYED